MKKYDDIEQLFRNKLKEQNIESGDWLTPPDFILDNAVKLVNERKKKRRRGAIILLFGIIAFVGLSTVFLRMSHRVNIPGEQEVQTNGDKDDHKFTVPLTAEITSVVEEEKIISAIDNKQSIDNNSSAPATHPISANQIKNSNHKTPLVKIDTESIHSETAQDHTRQKIVMQSDVFNTESRTHTTVDNPGLIASVEKINNALPGKLIYDRPLITHSHPNAPDSTNENDQRTILFAFGGANLSTLQMTDVSPGNFELTEYDNYYMGYQAGFGADISFNKRWTLTTSLSFNSFLNRSSYKSNELYQKAKEETRIDGGKVYRSNFKINSPLMNTSEEFLIDVENFSIEQDHALVNSTEIKERLNVLRTAVGLKYDVFRLNKLDIGISTGLSANTILNLNDNYRSIVTYDDLEMMKKEFQSGKIEMVNRFYLSTFANIEMDFRLDSDWSVSLNGGYEKSLGSIRKFDDSNPTKTNLGNINLNFGLKFRF